MGITPYVFPHHLHLIIELDDDVRFDRVDEVQPVLMGEEHPVFLLGDGVFAVPDGVNLFDGPIVAQERQLLDGNPRPLPVLALGVGAVQAIAVPEQPGILVRLAPVRSRQI